MVKIKSLYLPLRSLGLAETITPLYAAKDELHNHAVVLQEFLQR